MRIFNNPFTSKTFVLKWLEHFKSKSEERKFKTFEGLSFYKRGILPYYVNVGRNLTKGISYTVPEVLKSEIRKRVFLIYDVPGFFEMQMPENTKSLKLRKLKQYQGFLIDLEHYGDLKDYMTSNISKSSRYKFNKYKKRLELCFDIKYKMFYGDISKEEYSTIFKHFRHLLEKRFSDKQITNNNLHPREWEFYKDVVHPLILEKRASLFVVYNGDVPIGITLNYFSKKVLFDAITVFDIDYSKFHIGTVTIMKLIEWSIAQELKILDFSKGYFEYKKRWMTREYPFEYHLYYDSKSPASLLLAFIIKNYFTLKQFLREKEINELFHKLTFFFERGKKTATQSQKFAYDLEELSAPPEQDGLQEISLGNSKNVHLRKVIFDFLYLNTMKLSDLCLYAQASDRSIYFIFCGRAWRKITLK
ncbi:GNAT family N-acetyltransferase [Flavobacteriaceae bacterium 3-367]|uniref:GNAT family N-acetyltransferase n=1 Tax=Eudoraea algarum TaxID=3417568 RepID=UPI00326D339A